MAFAALEYAQVPGFAKVYVCGVFERWVSIYLQQVRGLNLAWALVADGRLAAGARACVVGGGFAGLAAAAALARRGVRVTLLERDSGLLRTQRANHVRRIHPHIHEWPRPGARERRAGLPILDWSAALSAEVAAQVLAAFDGESARSEIAVRLGAYGVALAPGPAVSWSGQAPQPFDAVVLALGLGIEKRFGALQLDSYWTDETIALEHPGPPRHHLVTGIGEGGLIDVLYLRLARFSHVDIADRLAEIEGMAAVQDRLLAIEAEIADASDSDANLLLDERYRALVVPPAVDALLRSRLRGDTRVTLNGPEPFPLASRADILNRFLVSRLIALGDVSYLPGRVTSIARAGAGFEVVLDRQLHHLDQVNVRHGTLPALKAAFPEIWDRYQPVRAELPHLTPEPAWGPF